MVKMMLKPFFKRFLGLFISMVVVSALSIGLLASFASAISNLTSTYKSYLSNYESIDAVVKTDILLRDDISTFSSEIDNVKNIDARLTLDAYLKKSDGRIITSRIFTFNEKENKCFKRYILSSIEKSNDKINISVVRKFADNNNFKLGDTLQIGYFGLFLDFYINEIVETPEAIQARANEYVWSDNTDFGYLYINETELDKALYNISVLIRNKMDSDPTFVDVINSFENEMGITIPDFVNEEIVGNNYASRFANQLLVEGYDNIPERETLNTVIDYLNNKGIKVVSSNEAHTLFYILYIENAIKQIRVAAIFLPIFFYFVTMVVVGLFINQIIKIMTPEIGIMMSIGVGKRDVIALFIVFSILMSLVAGVIGTVIGYLLNYLLSGTLINVYSMPTIPRGIDPLITIVAIIILVVFSILTTLIACQRIYKITPKDATINNESKRKKTPKFIEKFIEKAPMNIKLGINSIVQNPRRFFVSTFSIFAAFVIIILSLFFYVSKTELMEQTTERRFSFDCQVYMQEVLSDEKINDLKNKDFIISLEDCYYNYLKASTKNSDKEIYLECIAYNPNTTNNLVYIPSSDGYGETKIKESGIIINKTDAKELNVNVGDKIIINNLEVEVIDITLEYFHPIAYLSKDEMKRINDNYVSTLLINVNKNNENEFLEYLASNGYRGLTVFSESLKKDIHGIFDSIDIFIIIMVGFSFGMGFVILTIMSQNTLMEQKRQISVFRAIGFRMIDVSNLWALQSVLHLLISSLFAIPIGYLISYILLTLCSSQAQCYPIVFSFPAIMVSFGFIFLIVLLSHLISMLTIKRWNLANNTKSRE